MPLGKTLVTGNLGYIGPIVVNLLKKSSHEVVGLDCDFFCASEQLSEGFRPDKQILKDIRDICYEDLLEIENIIHLAGLSNDPLGQFDFNLTYEINYRSSVKLLEYAKAAGIKRFVFASSCSMYGAGDLDLDALAEEARLNPVSAYAYSKVFFEKELIAAKSTNFTPISMRNATAYGLSPNMRFDLVLNDFIVNAEKSNEIVIKSDGTPWRPLVHVKDIASLCVKFLSLDKDLVSGECFNIGSNSMNFRISELADLVADNFNRDIAVRIIGEGEVDKRSYSVSFNKLLDVLREDHVFVKVADGIQEIADWVKNSNLPIDSYFDAPYIRLKQLEHAMEKGRLNHDLRKP